jgi:FkbM family methyltransferase
MSTKYIIVTKSDKDAIDNNSNNQIFFPNKSLTYLMPAVNHSYYADRGLFEANLIEWCKQFCKKDALMLDIGAHTGSYAISLAPYAKKVLAFEPQRMTYYALCGGVALSAAENIVCIPFGLGSPEQVGELELKIVSNDGGGSSIHATSCILRTEKISINTLDSLNLQDTISFIKMDIEDNELHALKGATETIKRCGYPALLFESNRENKSLFDYIEGVLNYNIIKVGGYSNMFLAGPKK